MVFNATFNNILVIVVIQIVVLFC